MVISAAVSAANSTPACPPLPGQQATPIYVTNCSARVQHGLCGLELKTTPAVYKVTLPPSAAPSMWLAGVDGVVGVDGVK